MYGFKHTAIIKHAAWLCWTVWEKHSCSLHTYTRAHLLFVNRTIKDDNIIVLTLKTEPSFSGVECILHACPYKSLCCNLWHVIFPPFLMEDCRLLASMTCVGLLTWLCLYLYMKLKEDTIIHVWKGTQEQYQDEMSKVTSSGYQTLLSTPWYLNRIAYGQDWQDIYKADPHHFKGVCVRRCIKIARSQSACSLWFLFMKASINQ